MGLTQITTGGVDDNINIDSNTLKVDGTNNRVGIGTASPGKNLDIEASDPRLRLSSNASNNATVELLSNAKTSYIYSQNSGNLNLQANNELIFLTSGGTERMRIDQHGRVGINNTSPNSQFHNDLVIGTGSGSDAGLTIHTSTSGRGSIAFSDGTSGTSRYDGYLQYDHSNQSFKIYTNGGNERLRIDSSGRLLVGTSSARSNFNTGGNTAEFQVEGVGKGSFMRNLNDQYGSDLFLTKSRSTGNTSVNSSDIIGNISFQGNDGTNFVPAAIIQAVVDGTPGSNDMPGRLVFLTTADGASSPTERMRITNKGYLKATDDGTFSSSTGSVHEFRSSTTLDNTILFTVNNNSYAASGAGSLGIGVLRSASSSYNFAGWYSGNGSSTFSDREFQFRGDGQAYADGSWNGGGADYAEYFEWFDGNTAAEDRRGISVVLDGDKIREAVAGEEPIGVISGNPSVVGDAAWNKWNGKYLRDDFGTYIQENYEVEDEDGNTVVQQRRKLNPDYNPDVEYVSREDRPEWDCVGLMGKLRIRKGQVTGSRWIKMRDVSDSVEEWLVR